MANFSDLFVQLDQLGALDSLFPFILIFTVIYAILHKTHIIAEGRKSFNVIIAFVMSMMVVIPHIMGTYPRGQDVVEIINAAIPNVSLVVIAILSILILIGVFGQRLDIAGQSITGYFVMAAIGIVVYIFGVSAQWWNGFPPFLSFLQDPDTQALVIILAAFFIILWYITKEDKDSAEISGPLAGLMKGLGGMVKPK